MTRRFLVAAFLTSALACHGAVFADGKFDVTGTWEVQTEIAGRKATLQFAFKQDGSKLTGKLVGEHSQTDVSGTVNGDAIEFAFPTFGGKAVYKGTLRDQGQMQGEVSQVVSKGAWTAKRGSPTAITKPQNSPASGEAERRVKEFAGLLDSDNVAEFKKYVAENFAPSFLKLPMERHLEFFLSMHDSTRGVDVQSVEATSATEATVLVKARLTGRLLTLRARVEPAAPHRIVMVNAGPARPRASEAAKSKPTDEQIAQQMQSLMEKLAAADVFSGAVYLSRDGVPIFQGAYGTANKDFNVPNRIDTKFNLGSMNKMFTAVAIAQLVERGKLSFDDRLSKFLPEFPDPKSAEKIQIKHLLTHTAGLGGYFSKGWQDSSRALYRTVDDMLKRAAADERLIFEPGRVHRYSNTGMLVAGKVVEVASGQDYFEFIRENITGPTGMQNTDCYELDKVNPNLAVGYEKRFDENGISFRNNLFEHVMRGGPMGGGYSTVEDLSKFATALRSNKLVGAEYVDLLLSSKPELHSPKYGYGFAVDDQQHIAGHSGGFIGISSNLDMFLGSGWTAAVMSNYGRGTLIPEQAMREFVQLSLQAGG